MAEVKKLNEIDKVTTINTNDYIVMNAADGAPVQIKRSDFVAAILEAMPVANYRENGLENKLYAYSGSMSLAEGQTIDTGVITGLIRIYSSTSGNSYLAFIGRRAHEISEINVGTNFSSEDKSGYICIYKEGHDDSILIKNNTDKKVSITYHIL